MPRLPLDMTTAKLAVNRATYLLRNHAVLRGTARSPAFQSSVHQPPPCIEEHWRANKKVAPILLVTTPFVPTSNHSSADPSIRASQGNVQRRPCYIPAERPKITRTDGSWTNTPSVV